MEKEVQKTLDHQVPDRVAYQPKSEMLNQAVERWGVTASQIRLARAYFGWTQKDLAEQAHVSLATIRRMEEMYVGPQRRSLNSVSQVVAALERCGVMFIEADPERGLLGGMQFRAVVTAGGPSGGYDWTKEGAVTVE